MQIFGACIWKKVIILLDEYDTPMQEANVYGYWEEMTSFLRNLFNATFKTNKYCIDGLPNRNLLKEVVTMWWSIGCGIIIFTLGMFIFLKPGLIWKLTEEEFSKIQVSKNEDKNFRYIKCSGTLKILEIKL